MKTLVIGGTGTVGSRVVQNLVSKGVDVRLLTRYESKLRSLPQGVEGFIGDLANPDTLPPAFEGVDSMFFLIPVGPTETELGIAAVNEAVDAGIPRIVYMSVAMPDGSQVIPHFRSKIPIEQAVGASGLDYTILRPTNFYQNDLWVREAMLASSIYPTPIGDVGINRIDVRDIADAAITALLERGHSGRTYNLQGPDTWTGDAVAGVYSRCLGRGVRYGGSDLDAWAQQASAMLPDWMVRDFRIMYQFFQEHGFSVPDYQTAPMRDVVKHDPRKFEDFAAEVTQVWLREAARAQI